MGLFANREMYEKKLAQYGELIEKQRIFFGKYESLALKHGEQTKEYDQSLQRYENQLEIIKEDMIDYAVMLKHYEEVITSQEKKLEKYEEKMEVHKEDGKEIKNLLVESKEKIMLKSLENNNEIMETLEKALSSAEKHNKVMRVCLAFLLFFNLITLVIAGIIGFILMRPL